MPSALPCFKKFGNLPTDVVREDVQVNGKPALEALDMLITIGGNLGMSQSVKDNLVQEILQMADADRFALGGCSGMQIPTKATDIGRLSSTPILGLGRLDAEFKPLMCTDRVTATIVSKSFIMDDFGKVTGFHCYTYGKMITRKGVFLEKFKNSLITNFKFDVSGGGLKKR